MDAVITIPGSLPNGVVIHKVIGDDPDANDKIIFSIDGGNPNSAFAINGNTGELILNKVEGFDRLTNAVFQLTIRVQDAGGLSAIANLTIEIEKVDEDILIQPLKGFSPNGDGINDFWMIKGIEAFPDNEVKIFNRWGNLVFETRNYDNNNVTWRGLTNKGVPETTYFFFITVKGLQPITGYVVVKE